MSIKTTKKEKGLRPSPRQTKGPVENLKDAVGAAALAAALVVPTVSSAQGTDVYENGIKKEVTVEGNPKVENLDSTIIWAKTVSGQNLPDSKLGEISQEDVREYLRSNKDDFNKFVDKKTFETVYKEVLGNEKIQNFIKEMVNREDIRQAALEGKEQYIQQEINKHIDNYIYDNKEKRVAGGILLLYVVTAFVAIMRQIRKKNKTIKEQNNKKTKNDDSLVEENN